MKTGESQIKNWRGPAAAPVFIWDDFCSVPPSFFGTTSGPGGQLPLLGNAVCVARSQPVACQRESQIKTGQRASQKKLAGPGEPQIEKTGGAADQGPDGAGSPKMKLGSPQIIKLERAPCRSGRRPVSFSDSLLY